ncbi:MAG: hypothetical protein ACXQTR_01700 [Candidatus Methanospirareceae archaeon]
MRNQLERFVAAARISKQATIGAEFCFIFVLYFQYSGNTLLRDVRSLRVPCSRKVR